MADAPKLPLDHASSEIHESSIRYLRLKLEAEGEPHLIQTVRGIGYVLRESSLCIC